jgi:hypothetical protein
MVDSAENTSLLQYNRPGTIGGEETHRSGFDDQALPAKVLRDLAKPFFVVELKTGRDVFRPAFFLEEKSRPCTMIFHQRG